MRTFNVDVLLVVGAVGLLSGCGGGEAPRAKVVTVSGKVQVKGQPAAGVKIRLHPTNSTQAAAGLYPQATTDAQGEFKLSTYIPGDGAPPGEYQVTLVWPDESYQPAYGPEREAVLEGGEKPDKLQGKYKDPAASGLKASITDQSGQKLPTIEVP